MSSYIFLFFVTLITVLTYKLAAAANQISINCGSDAATSNSLNGREWVGDNDVPNPNFSIKGSSSSSVVKLGLTVVVDPVPYNTVRISRSQFTYTFHRLSSPGQKLIRLHFNPSHSYNDDFFTVEAGPFTLLSNFSPSIAASVLSLTTVSKEFCLITKPENQPLDIIFTPSQQQQDSSYAFINGIEIISLPSTLSYCHGGDNINMHDFFISLYSKYELFEIFKINNHDNSLAIPNPSPPPTTTLVSILGRRNAIATVLIVIFCLVSIIVHILRQYLESQLTEDDHKPSNKVLHLLNKMNIPAPFWSALPTPPLPASVPVLPPPSSAETNVKFLSSSESEMESSYEVIF